MPDNFEIIALAIIVLTSLSIWGFPRRKSSHRLPPGPKGYPLIGNLFDMPPNASKSWLTFADWGKKYGDISSVTIFGQTIVVLNSISAANDMLAAKSSIYSDRPRLVLTGELGGWNQAIGASPYNDRWKQLRKLFHSAIGTPAANKRFDHSKEIEARRLIRNILRSPEKLNDHLRLTAGATMLRDTYGYEVVDEMNDPIIAVATEALDQFSRTTTPPYYLVEYLPWLKHVPAWFPGAFFKRYAIQISETLERMAQMPYDYTKETLARTAPVSFVSSLLETNPGEEIMIKWSAKSLYSGASDTSVSAIYAAYLVMTLRPDIAERAQKEIDEVVGSDRLPTFADRPHMPYVNAFVKEIIRWNTVTPLGGPHRSTEDDVHMGYFIPNGSIIIANIWYVPIPLAHCVYTNPRPMIISFLNRQMSHDEATYSDPMTFNPERFLGPKPQLDPMEFAFGFGRRSCPGIWFADAAIFIGCAMSLAVFKVSKAVDPNTAEEITPVYDPLPGTVSHPSPFKLEIKPRSEKAKSLILNQEI
ncbi:cytochrome P450 [Cyathus striatus]|nr:cytochrome P450 [Cyathus striatus]